ncbi:unnamed protein product, partial [Trichogramma brassicae]
MSPARRRRMTRRAAAREHDGGVAETPGVTNHNRQNDYLQYTQHFSREGESVISDLSVRNSMTKSKHGPMRAFVRATRDVNKPAAASPLAPSSAPSAPHHRPNYCRIHLCFVHGCRRLTMNPEFLAKDSKLSKISLKTFSMVKLYFNLCLDEMSIRRHVSRNKSKEKFEGLVDFGRPTDCQDNEEQASNALVFMLDVVRMRRAVKTHPLSSLQVRKTYGALTSASQDVILICQTAEKISCLRTASVRNSMTKSKHGPMRAFVRATRDVNKPAAASPLAPSSAPSAPTTAISTVFSVHSICWIVCALREICVQLCHSTRHIFILQRLCVYNAICRTHVLLYKSAFLYICSGIAYRYILLYMGQNNTLLNFRPHIIRKNFSEIPYDYIEEEGFENTLSPRRGEIADEKTVDPSASVVRTTRIVRVSRPTYRKATGPDCAGWAEEESKGEAAGDAKHHLTGMMIPSSTQSSTETTTTLAYSAPVTTSGGFNSVPRSAPIASATTSHSAIRPANRPEGRPIRSPAGEDSRQTAPSRTTSARPINGNPERDLWEATNALIHARAWAEAADAAAWRKQREAEKAMQDAKEAAAMARRAALIAAEATEQARLAAAEADEAEKAVTEAATRRRYAERQALTGQRVVLGCLFQDVKLIRTDDSINLQAWTCFNCWQDDHERINCRKKQTRDFCYNCGRIGVHLPECPRCGEGYVRWLARHPEKKAFATKPSQAPKPEIRRPGPKVLVPPKAFLDRYPDEPERNHYDSIRNALRDVDLVTQVKILKGYFPKGASTSKAKRFDSATQNVAGALSPATAISHKSRACDRCTSTTTAVYDLLRCWRRLAMKSTLRDARSCTELMYAAETDLRITLLKYDDENLENDEILGYFTMYSFCYQLSESDVPSNYGRKHLCIYAYRARCCTHRARKTELKIETQSTTITTTSHL